MSDSTTASSPRAGTDLAALVRASALDSESRDADADREAWLVVRSGETRSATPAQWIREIVRVPPIAPLPHTPAWVRGVVAVRGEIFQVVDLRQRLARRATRLSRESRILVVQRGGEAVAGVLVDAVLEVARVAPSAVRAADADSNAVRGVIDRAGEPVSLLDLDRILEADVPS